MVRMRHLFMTLGFGLIPALLTLPGCGASGESALGTDSVATRVDTARARNDGPPLWILKDADSTVYFYGTVHLLPDDLSWQKDDMREAFQASGTIFFEVDTSEAAQVDATLATTNLGLRDDGTRLTDSLDNYQRNLLEAATHNGNLKIATLDAMQPWLASEFLTFAAAQNAGLSADLSADSALKSRAVRQGKNVIYLETTEAQLRASADLSTDIQLNILTETLEGFNQLGDDMTIVAEQWSVGGTDYLTQELVIPMKSRAPELYTSLLKDRNEKWAEEISDFMDGSGTAFVAVGVSHLLGEDSLLAQLHEQGFKIKRHFAFQGENVINTVDTSIRVE